MAVPIALPLPLPDGAPKTASRSYLCMQLNTLSHWALSSASGSSRLAAYPWVFAQPRVTARPPPSPEHLSLFHGLKKMSATRSLLRRRQIDVKFNCFASHGCRRTLASVWSPRQWMCWKWHFKPRDSWHYAAIDVWNIHELIKTLRSLCMHFVLKLPYQLLKISPWQPST